MKIENVSRRNFLKTSGFATGGLVVGVSLPLQAMTNNRFIDDADFNPNAFIQNNLHTLQEYTDQLLAAFNASETLISQMKDLPNEAFQPEKILSRLAEIKKRNDVEFIESDLALIFEESITGTKRIESIANGLKFFANPDTSTQKKADLNECVKQAQSLISLGEMEGCTLIKKLNDNLPSLECIPLLLSQAIANIIKNAAQSSPKSKQVTLVTQQIENNLSIKISDDGIGISKEKIRQIFDPFFSASEGAHKGLGLSISQSIIEQHHGEIQVQSEENVGTDVIIELPLNQI